MSEAAFEVVRVKDEGAYVRLLANTGEVLFHTEVVDSEAKAKSLVEDIVRTVGAVVEDHHASGSPLFRVRRPQS